MKAKAVLELTRIEHSAMLVIAVLAAELIAKGSFPSLPILALSLITPVFISMASFAINDYYDIEADRANKKKRPLVTGELKPIDALYVTAVSLLIGIIASALINIYAFAIALVFGLLALLYSYRLKGIVLLGNAYIAFSMAIPFIYGSYVVSSSIGPAIIFVSLMIFLSGLARETHGTVRDMEGDARRGFKTLPMAIGKEASGALALLLYLIAISISFYLLSSVAPFKYNLSFGAPIAVSDALLLYTAIGYLSVGSTRFYDRARNVSLIAMALALLALLLSPIKLIP